MSPKGFELMFVGCVWWWISGSIQAAENNSQQLASFWDTVPPGVLLQNLDALTADATSFLHVVPAPQPPQSDSLIPNAKDVVAKRLTKRDTLHQVGGKMKDQDSALAETAAAVAAAAAVGSAVTIPYDYDRAYEEFVKKYFDGAITKDLAAENSEHTAPSTLEHVDKLTTEYDVLGEASRTRTQKAKTCKSVKKNHQKCMICKNPRNGETSESCSFNREISPSKYAYKKSRNYHKYRKHKDDSNEDDENNDDSAEAHNNDDDNKDEKKSASTKSHVKSPAEEVYNKCLVRYYKHKICYRCENENGDKLHKCYGYLADKAYHHHHHNQHNSNNNKQENKKSRQKIHKRTAVAQLVDDGKPVTAASQSQQSIHLHNDYLPRRRIIITE